MEQIILMRILSLIFIILCHFFSGCVSGGSKQVIDQDLQVRLNQHKLKSLTPPGWVLGKGHTNFSDSEFLLGVGVSESNSVSANGSARTELAKILKVKIRSLMRDFSTETGVRVDSMIESQVDTVLEGVEIKDGWFDSKTYYSLAVLNRSLAGEFLLDQGARIRNQVKYNLTLADVNKNQGKLKRTLENLFSAYENASRVTPIKSAYRVIMKSNLVFENKLVEADQISAQISQLVQGVQLEKVSGDGQIIKTLQGLPEPLVVKVFQEKDNRPLSNIPILFYDLGSNREIIGNGISDAQGKVSSSVINIDHSKNRNRRISVQLNFNEIISGLDSRLITKYLSPLKDLKADFQYSVKTPEWKSGKSVAWKNGITQLVNQLIENLPPGGSPTVGIIGFQDLRSEKRTPFSRILQEDFKSILVQVDDLVLKEISVPKDALPYRTLAKQNGIDYFISGSYRLEKSGLEIRTLLTETATENIISSAQAQIDRREVHPDDLADFQNMFPQSIKNPEISNNQYDIELEKLLGAKPDQEAFQLKVWTEKSDYQIGDNITFKIETNRDAYLTLLDIGAGGNITVIFPNKYRKDNLIRGGNSLQIPGSLYGFKFNVQGPEGLERIKAIASSSPGLPIELDLQKGFHNIQRGTLKGMRDIKAMADRFSQNHPEKWGQAYTEIFIHKKDHIYFRGARKIPLLPKPKKPIDMIGTFGREENRSDQQK